MYMHQIQLAHEGGLSLRLLQHAERDGLFVIKEGVLEWLG